MRRLMLIRRRFRLRVPLLHSYLLQQFAVTLCVCLFASTSLFLVFDFFERINLFLREGVSFDKAVLYLLFKIPFIVHLMTPIAVLVSTLLTVGRLAQHSEITAMRACGVSLFWLAKPLVALGLCISLTMFIAGETVVPWATQQGEELYHFEIKKKIETGALSRANFWYRSKNKFYDIGYYDSKTASLHDISIFTMDDVFKLQKRIDAREATWRGNSIGWTMREAIEIAFDDSGKMRLSPLGTVPLVIKERPADFYAKRRDPETLSLIELRRYIEKLQAEGVPVTKYLVDLQSKISFPFVTAIVILIAFPFALIPARSGTLTLSFVGGISIGFGYYVFHALCSALGGAELLPVVVAAWAANILLTCVGGYFMAGAEHV